MEDNELAKNNIIAELLERIADAHDGQRELMTILEEFINGQDGYLANVALRSAYNLDPIACIKIISRRLNESELRRGEARIMAGLLNHIDDDFVKREKK